MGMLMESGVCLGQECVESSSFPVKHAMASDNKTQKDRPAEAARKKTMKVPADKPFDMWLHKQLHAMYDEIAAEPLPDDLLSLIERDAGNKDKSPDEK